MSSNDIEIGRGEAEAAPSAPTTSPTADANKLKDDPALASTEFTLTQVRYYFHAIYCIALAFGDQT